MAHSAVVLFLLFALSELLGEIKSVRENSVYGVFKRVMRWFVVLVSQHKKD